MCRRPRQEFRPHRHRRTGEKAIGRPYTLRLTDSAEADLAEIWSYIAAEASEEIASRFIGSLEARLERLRHAPFSGPARPQLAEGLRVAYTVRETEIMVVRVVHGARDHAAMADRGEFKAWQRVVGRDPRPGHNHYQDLSG